MSSLPDVIVSAAPVFVAIPGSQAYTRYDIGSYCLKPWSLMFPFFSYIDFSPGVHADAQIIE